MGFGKLTSNIDKVVNTIHVLSAFNFEGDGDELQEPQALPQYAQVGEWRPHEHVLQQVLQKQQVNREFYILCMIRVSTNMRNFKRSHLCVRKTVSYADKIRIYAHE